MRGKFLFVAFLSLLFNVHLIAKKPNKVDSNKSLPITYQSDYPAYVIYDSLGNMVSYKDMIQSLVSADICLFGEIHNDPISHWMEMSLLKSFYAVKGQNLVVGAEMWERDNQLIMDEMMLDKLIDGGAYTESSKLWPNFELDYKPLLQYAKKNDLHFVCTNIPRRYARIVYKKGIEYLDSLSSQAKSYLPPLPIHFDLTQPIYAKMASVFPSDEEYEKQLVPGKIKRGPMNSAKPSNLVKAQAIKDATMAYFILQNFKPGNFFFHFNGEMHSANHTSICYYLKYYRPDVKFKTVSVMRASKNIPFNKAFNRADFNIVIPEDMAVTYNASPL